MKLFLRDRITKGNFTLPKVNAYQNAGAMRCYALVRSLLWQLKSLTTSTVAVFGAKILLLKSYSFLNFWSVIILSYLIMVILPKILFLDRFPLLNNSTMAQQENRKI